MKAFILLPGETHRTTATPLALTTNVLNFKWSKINLKELRHLPKKPASSFWTPCERINQTKRLSGLLWEFQTPQADKRTTLKDVSLILLWLKNGIKRSNEVQWRYWIFFRVSQRAQICFKLRFRRHCNRIQSQRYLQNISQYFPTCSHRWQQRGPLPLGVEQIYLFIDDTNTANLPMRSIYTFPPKYALKHRIS